MASPSASVEDTLVALRIAFKNFRSSSGLQRPVIPPALKRRALAFLECGIKKEDIAQACGFSKQTIALWKAQVIPIPRKLAVVQESEPKNAGALPEVFLSQETVGQPILFRLPSGITFDVSRDDALWLVSKLGEAR